MEKVKIAKIIFKCLCVVAIILLMLTYIMPVFGSNDGSNKELYYMHHVSYNMYQFFSSISYFLIPLMAIAFLFAKMKNNKPIFFGLSSTYIALDIFFLIYLTQSISDKLDKYDYKYGYYINIFALMLLVASIAALLITHLIAKSYENDNIEPTDSDLSSQDTQSSRFFEIANLQKRLETLNDLKSQGILTKSEYEAKRSEIIKDLKI